MVRVRIVIFCCPIDAFSEPEKAASVFLGPALLVLLFPVRAVACVSEACDKDDDRAGRRVAGNHTCNEHVLPVPSVLVPLESFECIPFLIDDCTILAGNATAMWPWQVGREGREWGIHRATWRGAHLALLHVTNRCHSFSSIYFPARLESSSCSSTSSCSSSSLAFFVDRWLPTSLENEEARQQKTLEERQRHKRCIRVSRFPGKPTSTRSKSVKKEKNTARLNLPLFIVSVAATDG